MGDLGDDTLQGGAGDDTLTGGAGADVLAGGVLNEDGSFNDSGDNGGTDTADYSGSDAGVTIDLTRTPRGAAEGSAAGAGGHAEGDVLHGIENLTGSDYTDLLRGTTAPMCWRAPAATTGTIRTPRTWKAASSA